MFVPSVCLLFGILLVSIEFVLSDILCENSRIDSITYANDVQMYFFTSGGYYWWLKEKDFPPKDSAAKRLPSPFNKGQAAVYLDTDNGCSSSKTDKSVTDGIRPLEKEIWIEEYVGGEHKLLAFDTKLNKWRDQTLVYNKDHCISRARINWASGRPLDAMFVRNYLEIYFVQDNNYAMVDCNFICTDSKGYGNDKPVNNIKDLHSEEPIFAAFVKRNKLLYVFHIKTFYEMSIQPNSRNGKLVTVISKDSQQKDIIKDFFKIVNPGQCRQTTTEPVPQSYPTPLGQREPGAPQPAIDQSKGDDPSEDETSSGWPIISIVVAVVVVITIIVTIAFFAMRSKSSAEPQEEIEKAYKDKKPPKLEAGVPSKTVGPGVGPKKKTSTFGNTSAKTNKKSDMKIVGMF